MIEIWLNSERCDISVGTIVGLNKQPFDITNVPSTRVSYTNSFTLPRTPTNEKIINFASIAGNKSTVPYNSLPCKIIDGFIIGEGVAVINSITDNAINVNFFSNEKTFIGLATNDTINDVLTDIVDAADSIETGSNLGDLIDTLITGFEGFKYPLQSQFCNSSKDVYISKQYASGNLQRHSSLWFSLDTLISTFCTANGYTYTDSTGLDLYFNTNVTVKYNEPAPFLGGYVLAYISPNTDAATYANYSMLDIIKVYAQKTNSFIEINEKDKTVKVLPFSSLYSTEDRTLNTKLVSWSKRYNLSSYAQSNIIDFKAGEGVNIADYQMLFSVTNANIAESKKYLTINSYAPSYLYYDDFDWADFKFEEPPGESIPLMYIDNTDTNGVNVYIKIANGTTSTTRTATKQLERLKWYDGTAFYTDMETPVLDKLEVFDAEVFINSIDYLGISPYKKYFFEQLGGHFIINKVSGFNPSSNGTTKLELIRIR